MVTKREYLMKKMYGIMMKIVIMKRVGKYWLNRRFLLELEEGQNNKSGEAWKKIWRGLVWEEMKCWNIWRKIASVIFCCFEHFSPIS